VIEARVLVIALDAFLAAKREAGLEDGSVSEEAREAFLGSVSAAPAETWRQEGIEPRLRTMALNSIVKVRTKR